MPYVINKNTDEIKKVTSQAAKAMCNRTSLNNRRNAQWNPIPASSVHAIRKHDSLAIKYSKMFNEEYPKLIIGKPIPKEYEKKISYAVANNGIYLKEGKETYIVITYNQIRRSGKTLLDYKDLFPEIDLDGPDQEPVENTDNQ